MNDVEEKILPGITHWQSPDFFAYFPASMYNVFWIGRTVRKWLILRSFNADSSYPGMVADMLCTAFNVIGFSWVNSPACTELETIVIDWLAKLAGLPQCFFSGERGSLVTREG